MWHEDPPLATVDHMRQRLPYGRWNPTLATADLTVGPDSGGPAVLVGSWVAAPPDRRGRFGFFGPADAARRLDKVFPQATRSDAGDVTIFGGMWRGSMPPLPHYTLRNGRLKATGEWWYEVAVAAVAVALTAGAAFVVGLLALANVLPIWLGLVVGALVAVTGRLCLQSARLVSWQRRLAAEIGAGTAQQICRGDGTPLEPIV